MKRDRYTSSKKASLRKPGTQELKKLSSAVEQTADPVIITSADGRIEYVNAAFEKVTGFGVQDAVGRTPRILKSGRHSSKFYRHLWDTILAGEPWRGTLVNRKKDGQLYFAETSIAPIFSSRGKITHFVSVERDITERERAERRLQRYTDEISDLYNNAPCGYHSLDAQGVFLRINDTELGWLGFSRGEVVGKKKFTDVIRENSVPTFQEQFEILKKRGWVHDVELQMACRDGTTRPVLWSASTINDEAGNYSMSRDTVFDITERLVLEKMKEIEWRGAQEMEIARQVQERLFLQAAPALQTLQCAGTCTQARSVGGDYYNFFNLGLGRLGLVVADVSGKGFSSALLMASLHAGLRTQCELAAADLPRMLASLNTLLYESTDPNTFVSLFFGDYDDAHRRLRYANCGHNPPLLLRSDGKVDALAATGTPLGFHQDWQCSVAEAQLAPGDTLVLFTDGIQEAFNGSDEEFGAGRLVEIARANEHLPVTSLLPLIAAAVHKFSGGRREDDQTLILARVR